MDDRPIEWRRGDLLVSTDRERLDLAAVLGLLRVTHWGGALSTEVLVRALDHSVCFGMYEGDALLPGAALLTARRRVCGVGRARTSTTATSVRRRTGGSA